MRKDVGLAETGRSVVEVEKKSDTLYFGFVINSKVEGNTYDNNCNYVYM